MSIATGPASHAAACIIGKTEIQRPVKSWLKRTCSHPSRSEVENGLSSPEGCTASQQDLLQQQLELCLETEVAGEHFFEGQPHDLRRLNGRSPQFLRRLLG